MSTEIEVKFKAASFAGVLVQIMLLDIVFSLDSVITAVGMAQHLSIMIAAMVIAMLVMLVFAGPIGDFVEIWYGLDKAIATAIDRLAFPNASRIRAVPQAATQQPHSMQRSRR